MKQVEELAGLRDRAEQRVVAVVAAGALALPVVADGTTFGMAPRAQHRTIEVDRDPRELLLPQSIDYQVAVEGAHGVGTCQARLFTKRQGLQIHDMISAFIGDCEVWLQGVLHSAKHSA